ncbi:FAD-binding protein, partial [Achromobacter insolitus]|uniref:FAD-binding protein n=1 Tax=Achromobacter insolitus TaxID=217204 RepID=UPI002FDD1DEC
MPASGPPRTIGGSLMEFDVIIIGSGLAGMAAGLELAPRKRVALVSKGELRDSASNRA